MKSNKTSSKDLHPWVIQTTTSLNNSKNEYNGLFRPEGVHYLNVFVSKESIPRSMAIWDRILKGAESAAFKIRYTQEFPFRTIVTVDGEDFSVGLREKTARIERVPTTAETEKMERLKNFHSVPEWVYRPSGKLVLVIEYINCHNQTVNQVTWADGGKKRIEDRLNDIVDTFFNIAAEIKRKRKNVEEQSRLWNEKQRLRQEAARLQAEEKRRTEILEQQAKSWKLASSIRQFANTIREEAIRRHGVVEPDSPLDQWIKSAERHADTIDPVVSLLSSLKSVEVRGYTSSCPRI